MESFKSICLYITSNRKKHLRVFTEKAFNIYASFDLVMTYTEEVHFRINCLTTFRNKFGVNIWSRWKYSEHMNVGTATSSNFTVLWKYLRSASLRICKWSWKLSLNWTKHIEFEYFMSDTCSIMEIIPQRIFVEIFLNEANVIMENEIWFEKLISKNLCSKLSTFN